MDGGMLLRNGCDGSVLRYGAGERHQQPGPPPSGIYRAGSAIIIRKPIQYPARENDAELKLKYQNTRLGPKGIISRAGL